MHTMLGKKPACPLEKGVIPNVLKWRIYIILMSYFDSRNGAQIEAMQSMW
jgi:hypothetical protein